MSGSRFSGVNSAGKVNKVDGNPSGRSPWP